MWHGHSMSFLSGIYPYVRTVRIPHDGMTADQKRRPTLCPTCRTAAKDVRHHRGEETGCFRRHHGQGPEPCAACYFLRDIYIYYPIRDILWSNNHYLMFLGLLACKKLAHPFGT